MEISRKWRFSWCLLLGLFLLATTLQSVQGEEESEAPSQCKPFIEKALKEQQKDEVDASNEQQDQGDTIPDDSEHDTSAGEHDSETGDTANAIESAETQQDEEGEVSAEVEQSEQPDEASVEKEEDAVEIEDATETESQEEAQAESAEEMQADQAPVEEEQSQEAQSAEAQEEGETEEAKEGESAEAQEKSQEDEAAASTEESAETGITESGEAGEGSPETGAESQEAEPADDATEHSEEQPASTETQDEAAAESTEDQAEPSAEQGDSAEAAEQSTEAEGKEEQSVEAAEQTADAAESVEKTDEPTETATESTETTEDTDKESAETTESVETEGDVKSTEDDAKSAEDDTKSGEDETKSGEDDAKSAEADVEESLEVKEQAVDVQADQTAEGSESVEEVEPKEGEESETKEEDQGKEQGEAEAEAEAEAEEEVQEVEESKEVVPEEDLTQEIEIPENLRPRDHVDQLLKLDDPNTKAESVLNKISEITLKELKKVYENAIKPLETLYKYRDLSNRHFGDSEIFSKPLVVFMGPWSGGKSSIINYLLDNEYNITSLRTGAEPSPAYFNLLMHGDEPEVLDGTQLAADFTFAGLQKFGQGLEERLRGLKLPNKLLEKINIVEIPGILEVRKQVSRVFPFNDACQWFIDRADIIFLVYDPSKLDVGPETEAILDQLKGREHQTRIVLNKADQVQPEELMRVQSALIWNISPLMSSAQPPVMYTTSLWSRPYETWAPVRLLHAQERAFLRDLRTAVDKRIENKISSARRFAVRVRNHAKMVDCYLTTYYNHKSVFGNRKQVSDQIIEHPQDYHIYEGLSTLTNISRYDLPDPDTYRDFFRLNPLYDFQQLSATCTYFRGCPINRLDVAIAYDLPELVGKHKKHVESAYTQIKAADNS